MIAKFHSAPGHSMETTLTINIPPPERIRAAKGEKLREKQKDKDKGEALQGRKEDENHLREKDEERPRKDEREREREKLERERRALAERGTSYKDKFQKMREKYDRVTSTHETHLQELDILNSKIKKLQAENDLLLDAVFLADAPLYDRYFPSGPGFGPPPIGHPRSQPHPPQPGISSSPHSIKPGHGHASYAQHLNEPPMAGLLQPFSTTSRFIDNPTASSTGPSPKHGHYQYHQQSHGQNAEPQEQQSKSRPFYTYPSREPMLPDPNPSSAHYRQSQPSTYRHYPPTPSDHHGMPPPPPPIPGSDSERERQREKEWERERARREWEWERERGARHPSNKESGGLPVTPPLVPAVALPPSNGYNPLTPNGHGYAHGSEYGHSGHSRPPLPSATHTHVRRSSRSASRRRNEGMDVDAGMAPPSPDVERSLGGPVHLDMDLEAAREKERGVHGRSAEQDEMGRDTIAGGRRRRSSEGQKLAMGNLPPPMGMLEPPASEQASLRLRHEERRQSPRREREKEGYGYDPTRRTLGDIAADYPSDSESDEAWETQLKYEYLRRHWSDLGGRNESSGGMERGFKRACEEEEEEEEERDVENEGKVDKMKVMDVDQAN